MQRKKRTAKRPAASAAVTVPSDYVFALDIGTRSVIGMVALPRGEKVEVCAVEIAEHEKRAMIDGQIEDIEQVARVASAVKERLEARVGYPLKKVCVAAAGRALRTQKAHYELVLDEPQEITEEILCRLEAGAIQQAEELFAPEAAGEGESVFYLAGYSATRYTLDNYPLAKLLEHRGQVLTADVIATFLPREVVDSLYTAMRKSGLEISSLTLEPIAAMNAAIPQNLRLLNLALVDIGAGTSDIAVSKDGGVVGYTMATIAGDEITEALMKEYLIDFSAAEKVKLQLGQEEDVVFEDILGLPQQIPVSELKEKIQPMLRRLAQEICERILQANEVAPSAVFLVGGGSKLPGLCECVAELLELPPARVAVGGKNFAGYLTEPDDTLTGPEFATPLGIAVSSALNLISDSFTIMLNGSNAKLFRSNSLSVLDVLMMNGYRYNQMINRSGKSLVFELDGESRMIYGGHPTLAKIQLNGKEVTLSDMVRAGDSIHFEPAHPGKDAQMTLGEAVDLSSPGSVLLRDKEIPLGIRATVNGTPGISSRPLRARDRVRTRSVHTLGELLSYAGEPEESVFLVNGEALPLHTPLSPGDYIEPAVQKESAPVPPIVAAPVPPIVATPKPTKELPVAPTLVQEPALISGIEEALATVVPEPELEMEQDQPLMASELESDADSSTEVSLTEDTPATAESAGRLIRLMLNQSYLSLPSKPDGSSYCLIDMLSHVDIDLSNPQGNIVVKLNGQTAGYLESLKTGDRVEIYWEGQSTAPQP